MTAPLDFPSPCPSLVLSRWLVRLCGFRPDQKTVRCAQTRAIGLATTLRSPLRSAAAIATWKRSSVRATWLRRKETGFTYALGMLPTSDAKVLTRTVS